MKRMFDIRTEAQKRWDYVFNYVSPDAIIDSLIYCWATDDLVEYAKWIVEELGLHEFAPTQITCDKRRYGESLWDYVREYVSSDVIIDTLIYLWSVEDAAKFADWMLEEFELTDDYTNSRVEDWMFEEFGLEEED